MMTDSLEMIREENSCMDDDNVELLDHGQHLLLLSSPSSSTTRPSTTTNTTATETSNYVCYSCNDDDDDDDDDCKRQQFVIVESTTEDGNDDDDDDTVVSDNLTHSRIITDPSNFRRYRKLYGQRKSDCCCGGISPWWCCTVGWTTVMVMALLLLMTTRNWPQQHNGMLQVGFQTMQPVPNIEDVYLESPFVLRINCGSHDIYLDTVGNIWFPDSTNDETNHVIRNLNLFAVTTSTTSFDHVDNSKEDTIVAVNAPSPIPLGTEGSELYNVERQFTTQGQYDIVVPWNGEYRVELYFVETHRKPRLFDIYIEDELMVAEYNIYEEANNRLYTATALNYTVHVTDDVLSIQFTSRTLDMPAKISGIQISSA